ncbi:unnamed protein product [Pleuronectes platessa]|uniref:Uncharacterized protein n=1 Tax=Pleuronectes platessa TaxID=8262 RepID=A0A9N7Y8K6_PLEPL|nr:unnamed protein product [Pleuronectes platessa]
MGACTYMHTRALPIAPNQYRLPRLLLPSPTLFIAHLWLSLFHPLSQQGAGDSDTPAIIYRTVRFYRGDKDGFISAEINIKWWPSSINPFVRPSNSSRERNAALSRAQQQQQQQWWNGGEIRELLTSTTRVQETVVCLFESVALSLARPNMVYSNEYTRHTVLVELKQSFCSVVSCSVATSEVRLCSAVPHIVPWLLVPWLLVPDGWRNGAGEKPGHLPHNGEMESAHCLVSCNILALSNGRGRAIRGHARPEVTSDHTFPGGPLSVWTHHVLLDPQIMSLVITCEEPGCLFSVEPGSTQSASLLGCSVLYTLQCAVGCLSWQSKAVSPPPYPFPPFSSPPPNAHPSAQLIPPSSHCPHPPTTSAPNPILLKTVIEQRGMLGL